MLLSEAVQMHGVELVGPSYSVYRYTDQIYKVVHFHSTKLRVGPVKKRGEKADPEKGSDLRARIVAMLNKKGVKISDAEIDQLVAELSGSIE